MMHTFKLILTALMQAALRFMAVIRQPSQLQELKTLSEAVKGSVGSKEYRHLYAFNGEDVVYGQLGCAFYVSRVLASFGLISTMRASVSGLERELKLCGWKNLGPCSSAPVGSVIIWESVMHEGDVTSHAHIGFGMDGGAVSTSYQTGEPVWHDQRTTPHYNGEREIRAVYILSRLTT